VSVVSGSAGELHHHLFGRPDGDRVFIVWDRTGSPTLRVRIPGDALSSTEYDVDGRPLGRHASAPGFETVKLAPGVPRIFRITPKQTAP